MLAADGGGKLGKLTSEGAFTLPVWDGMPHEDVPGAGDQLSGKSTYDDVGDFSCRDLAPCPFRHAVPAFTQNALGRLYHQCFEIPPTIMAHAARPLGLAAAQNRGIQSDVAD